MGLSFGKSLQMQQNMIAEELNLDIFFDAVNDALANKDVDIELMNEFMNNYMYTVNPQKCAEKSTAWLEEKDLQEGVQITESGLRYKIVKEGDAEKKATNDNDTVEVNYEGKLMNGYVFDSSYERNEPAKFPLNRVIKGWTEGMKLVGEGGEIILYIPANLAYGQWGNQRGGIGPNQALEFRVELLSVTPAEAK
jgi:FKBP-type peptidyl-prolyl cis-trans isomerase